MNVSTQELIYLIGQKEVERFALERALAQEKARVGDLEETNRQLQAALSTVSGDPA